MCRPIVICTQRGWAGIRGSRPPAARGVYENDTNPMVLGEEPSAPVTVYPPLQIACNHKTWLCPWPWYIVICIASLTCSNSETLVTENIAVTGLLGQSGILDSHSLQ